MSAARGHDRDDHTIASVHATATHRFGWLDLDRVLTDTVQPRPSPVPPPNLGELVPEAGLAVVGHVVGGYAVILRRASIKTSQRSQSR